MRKEIIAYICLTEFLIMLLVVGLLPIISSFKEEMLILIGSICMQITVLFGIVMMEAQK